MGRNKMSREKYAIKNVHKDGDFFMGSLDGEFVTDIWSCDIETEFDDICFFDEIEEAEEALDFLQGYCPNVEIVKVIISDNGYLIEEY